MKAIAIFLLFSCLVLLQTTASPLTSNAYVENNRFLKSLKPGLESVSEYTLDLLKKIIIPSYAEEWFTPDAVQVLTTELANRDINPSCSEHVLAFTLKIANFLNKTVLLNEDPWYFHSKKT